MPDILFVVKSITAIVVTVESDKVKLIILRFTAGFGTLIPILPGTVISLVIHGIKYGTMTMNHLD